MDTNDGRNAASAARRAEDADTRGHATHAPSAPVGGVGGVGAALGQALLVLIGLAAAFAGSTLLAWIWFAVCRLAYVLFVGLSLRAESLHRALSRDVGRERAWLVFRTRASRVMVADAVAIGALCVATRGTLQLPLLPCVLVGAALVALGIGIKLWATASLDAGTFYWRDFFVEAERRSFSATGPYRWMSNPMYTVGYAHAYGLALVLRSVEGLVGAALAQIAILLLAALVEAPHVRRLQKG